MWRELRTNHRRPGRRALAVAMVLLLSLAGAHARQQPSGLARQLLVAAANGDVRAVGELLAKGADVNSDNGHGVTPLWYAADQANVALVKLLLERGADPNAKDLEYGKSPLRVAAVPWSDIKEPEARRQIVGLMIEKGGGAEGDALGDLIRGGFLEAAEAIIRRGTADRSFLNQALAVAKQTERPALVELLTKAGAVDPGPADSARSSARLKQLTGVYRSESGRELTLRPSIYEDQLLLERPGGGRVLLLPADLTILRSFDLKVVVSLKPSPLPPPQVTLKEGGQSAVFTRVGEVSAEVRTTRTERRGGATVSEGKVAARHAGEWPSFRGPGGSGVAVGGSPPVVWDVKTGSNVKWKTPIPGFAHSSPIVWGNRIFLTTTVPAESAELTFRLGSGEEGGASAYTKDDFPHSWRVYALDKDSGKILWERVAHEGRPLTARHVKASQANSTPATDGTHVVVFFGSEGLYCYDVDGTLLWKRDLGPMPSGRYLDPSYEWNTAASPIIYKDRVILQLDLADEAYIMALDVKTGKEIWRTKRDEQPSWPTPFIYEDGTRTELITAAPLYTRSYDPDTGKELWRLGKHSALSTPTPIAGNGLIFITSGGGTTVQPIYAIRPGATGDITLADGDDANDHVVWSKHRGGSYIPTPIFYEGLPYLCSNNGIVTAYRPDTGERVYQNRLTRGGGFTASPVAADGRLYFASEDGEVVVVRAGETFEVLASNTMGDVIMATPAIARELLVIRTQHHLYGLAATGPAVSRAR